MPVERVGVEIVALGADRASRLVDEADRRVNKFADTVENTEKRIGSGRRRGLARVGEIFRDIGRRATEGGNLVSRGLNRMGRAVTSAVGQFQRGSRPIGRFFSLLGTGASRAVGGLARGLSAVGGQIGGFASSIVNLVPGLGRAVGGLSSFTGGLGALGVAGGVAAAAVLGVVAAIGGVIALGARGAGFEGIVEEFNRSGVSLEKLRESSRGYISDVVLMTQTNIGLAGTQGQLRKEFGEAFPRLLEIAGALARKTGGDQQFYFESLVGGIKRSSPLIIDNTGLVLKTGEANETYAESIGKTVEELSGQEKQIALINAVLAAGEQALDGYGDAVETNREKLSGFGATLSNIFDAAAASVEPLFGLMLDFGNAVLDIGSEVLEPVLSVVLAIGERLEDALGPAIQGVSEDTESIASSILGFFGRLARGAARWAGTFVGTIESVLDAARNLFSNFASGVARLLIGESPPPEGPLSRIDVGGRNTALAWIAGFLGVSVDPVSQVAAEVNEALGSIGTFNQRQVERRIEELDRALQPFADRVEILTARFEQLAEPAERALDAIDRQTDALIQRVVDGDARAAAAVRTLRQQRGELQGILDLEQRNVDLATIQLELVRGRQREERVLLGIRSRAFEEEESGLNRVSTARETAARKMAAARRRAERSRAGSGSGAGAGADDAQPGSGLAGTPGDFSLVDSSFGHDFLDGLGATFEEARNLARFGLPFDPNLDFLEGLGSEGSPFDPLIGVRGDGGEPPEALSLFERLLGGIGDFVSDIPDALGDLTKTLLAHLLGPFKEPVDSILDFFGIGGTDSLVDRLSGFVSGVPGTLSGLKDQLLSLSNPFLDAVTLIGSWLIGESPPAAGPLADITGGATRTFQAWVDGFKVVSLDPIRARAKEIAQILGAEEGDTESGASSLRAAFESITGPEGLQSWLTSFDSHLHLYFTLPLVKRVNDASALLLNNNPEVNVAYSLKSAFEAITGAEGVKLWLSGFPSALTSFLVSPFAAAITLLSRLLIDPAGVTIGGGEGAGGSGPVGLALVMDYFFDEAGEEGTFKGYLDKGITLATQFVQGVGFALGSFGTVIWTTVGLPWVRILNFLIDRANEAINSIIQAFDPLEGFLGSEGLIPTVSVIPNISTAVPEFLQNPYGDIAGGLPGAATGGVFGPGSVIVGERGPEIVTPAQRFGVFPHEATVALQRLSSFLTGTYRYPAYAPAGVSNHRSSTSVQQDNRVVTSFVPVGDERRARREQRLARARSRSRLRRR